MPRERLYQIWVDMRKRCKNQSHKNYDRYGGRGVAVCEEWDGSFAAFRKWAIGNGYTDNLTIDRHPNRSGNYEPSNCRWATRSQQSQNRDVPRQYRRSPRKRAGKGPITCGFIGVTWRAASTTWLARIRVDGKQIDVGTFRQALSAALAYDAAAILAFGEEAQLNFPERKGRPLPTHARPGRRGGSRRQAIGCTKTKRGKWQSQITANGRTKYIGLFDTQEDATAAYQSKLKQLT
jgi:hypothetical protein